MIILMQNKPTLSKDNKIKNRMTQMKISNKAGAISSNTDLWKDTASDIFGEQKQDIGRITDTHKNDWWKTDKTRRG